MPVEQGLEISSRGLPKRVFGRLRSQAPKETLGRLRADYCEITLDIQPTAGVDLLVDLVALYDITLHGLIVAHL